MEDALAFNFRERSASKETSGSLPLNWKRLGVGRLCLACGKMMGCPTCCEKCGLAFFCGPKCQAAAASTHEGACAIACGVTSRLMHDRQPHDNDMKSLREFVSIIGRHCNPVSVSRNTGPNSIGSKEALRFLQEHKALVQSVVADHLFVCCRLLVRERVCCNPHIYAWCLLDGCLKEGSINKFMERINLGPAHADSLLSKEQAEQRHKQWLRTDVLPLQEMFGQIGIGRFWDKTPRFPEIASLANCRTLDDCASLRKQCVVAESQRNSATFQRSLSHCL